MGFKRSIFFSIAGRFSTLVTGFGSFLILVRMYDQRDFGVWALFLTISTIIEMARNGLVRTSFIRFYSGGSDEEKGAVFGNSWWLSFAFTVVSFIVMLIASPFVSAHLDYPDFFWIFLCYGVSSFLLVPLSQLQFFQQAHMDFQSVMISTLVRQLTFLITIFLLFVLDIHVKLSTLVLIQGGGIGLAAIPAYMMTRQKIELDFTLRREWLKKQFDFGKYVLGTNVSSLVFKGIDQTMLAFMLSPQASAIYSVAIRVANLIEYPATSIAEVVYPRSIKKLSEHGASYISEIYNEALGLCLAVVAPLILATILLSDFIVPIIAGPEYAYSSYVLKLTMIFGFITPFNRQFGVALDALGKPQMNFRILLMAVVVNLASNYVFISTFGLIGAAYGTLTSYLVVFTVNHTVFSKSLGLSPIPSFSYAINYYRLGWDYCINRIKTQLGR